MNGLPDTLRGQLAAQNLLLEQIYVIFLRNEPPGSGAMIADTQMRMVDEDEPANASRLNPDEQFRIRQHALHHLEKFWKRVLPLCP